MTRKLFTFALALLTAASAWAYDFKSGDLYYNITDESAKTVAVTYEEYYSSNNYTSLSGAVTIPETVSYNGTSYSVTSIGYAAFANCSALTQVTIPDGVESIGGEAFSGCSALTQVTIPDGVESIGGEAFSGCSALTQVTIGNSVESIGSDAFKGTALYNNADNWTNNVLYIDNCLIKAKEELSGSYEIATGTRVIADGAFHWCSALTQVTIPGSVTSIGSSAFEGCSALTQVTIPNSVTSIGDFAFYGCSALTQVTIGNNVTSIGSSAFSYCSALTQVTIPESVTSIGEGAFSYCEALMQVTIPGSVTSIGDGAFNYCSALAEITVLPTVPPTITTNTFSNINPQVKVNIPEGSRDAYMADEDWKWLLDLSAGQLSGTCGDNLTWTFTTADCTLTISGTGDMYDYGYRDQPWYNFNQGIKNISLPDGMTSIGDCAFRDCSALTQVTIPGSVTSIGEGAFYYCSALTQVTIGDGVESIGNWAFSNCSALTEVTIPGSVKRIGELAFAGCSALTAVYYTGDVAGWCGITFNGYASNPLNYAQNLYIGNTLVTELAIPEGVTEIKAYAFSGCSALTQVNIPNSVTSIGEWAFNYCEALTQVTIGNGVKSIGSSAFSYCSALNAINVEGSNTTYCSENGILFNKDKTTLVCYPAGKPETVYAIPESVTSIGNSAFEGCSALTQVTIPNSVTSIGDFAFYGCSALTQVTIGNNVTSIGVSAFQYCYALAEMTVLATVPPTVGVDAFYNVSRDIPVYVPAEALEDYQAAAVWEEFYYLQAMPTGLHTPSMPESIRVYGGMLHNPQGLPVSLYDIQGRMVYSGIAATVSQPAGVYVLRCAGASSKVLF